LLGEGEDPSGPLPPPSAHAASRGAAALAPRELRWAEPPAQLGEAPSERGFSAWLLGALPSLGRELGDPGVCFGVSVGGDVDHAAGTLRNWWPGGGHPRQWGSARPSPSVAALMGLPADRTFVLHDGEAHLLGCSRQVLPPPSLGCFALGTGVGFGLSSGSGSVVDPSSRFGAKQTSLNGVPLSGARYPGTWRRWLERPGACRDAAEAVMAQPFANIVDHPFRMPWVSLVLGRRGIELAEAAHGCPAPPPGGGAACDAAGREPAVRAYGEQWLHFLHTQVAPQFNGDPRPAASIPPICWVSGPVRSVCFAGGIAAQNWATLGDVLVEPCGRGLRALAGHQAAGPEVSVLPLAPEGSGLIGAGVYALAGTGAVPFAARPEAARGQERAELQGRAGHAALLQPLSWEAAGVKAQGTLGRMSADDKHKAGPQGKGAQCTAVGPCLAMQMARVLVASVALQAALVHCAANQATSSLRFDEAGPNRPVSKVITLLKDMLKQLESEADKDEEIYDRLACWCETNEKEKTASIKAAGERIAQLEAKIEEDAALSVKLESEMRELEAEVAKNQAALDKATSIREREQADFNAEEKELLEAITALKSAVTVLAKHHGGAASLLQAPGASAAGVASALQRVLAGHGARLQGVLTRSERRAAAAFIQSPQDYFDAEPTFKQSYAPQSGEIFGILEQMKSAFEKDLSQSQKAEMANQKAYDELKAAKNEQIEAGQAQIDKKTQEKAETDERLAGSKEDLEDTHEALAADEKFLALLKEKCSMTDAEWEERQKTRAAEMAAVSKALAILASDDAHDLYARTFNKAASLVQRRSSEQSARRGRASELLTAAARRLHSQALSRLALSARLDAFEKVKKAIDDMLSALQEQQAAEVKHKDFCVAELNENGLQTEKKTMEKQDLEAKIAQLETTIKHLTEDIDTLKAEIAEMELQMKRAGETREKENAEFQVTVADQRATQQILKKALVALEGFYGKQAALLQRQAPEGFAPPPGFEEYKKSAGSSGVMALISQIASDAKAMEDETVRAEEDMQKAYEAFVIETNASIEAKGKAIVNKSEEKAKAEERLVAAQADLDSVTTELGELADYGAQLHSSCDFTLKNFDLRQEARMEEMDALRQAKQILSGADFGAFLQLLTGLGWDGDLQKWFYVGNTAPIPELGIPSLNMQDAASGFRTYWTELVGTVTCWPSLLSMAATWDPDAVEMYAQAVGEEFKGKGANGILGPSVDVHRVARNGRNFEYLSGEDPYLGSVLAKAYVRGVQSQGVFAVMKHWIFNSQETNRDYQSSIVDDKTAWELYYPPFQAAVDAGVSAAMCSYNRIGGQYSCANEKTLQTVLKDQMGFKGFIQTDWWAAKAMGMPAGLDQEMPGSHGGGPGSDVFFTPEGLASQDPQRVDDAVYRVLSVIYRLQLETSTPCSAP
ncbi:unnamed protein product, partial [Prorocentrum cordatum]